MKGGENTKLTILDFRISGMIGSSDRIKQISLESDCLEVIV